MRSGVLFWQTNPDVSSGLWTGTYPIDQWHDILRMPSRLYTLAYEKEARQDENVEKSRSKDRLFCIGIMVRQHSSAIRDSAQVMNNVYCKNIFKNPGLLPISRYSTSWLRKVESDRFSSRKSWIWRSPDWYSQNIVKKIFKKKLGRNTQTAGKLHDVSIYYLGFQPQ